MVKIFNSFPYINHGKSYTKDTKPVGNISFGVSPKNLTQNATNGAKKAVSNIREKTTTKELTPDKIEDYANSIANKYMKDNYGAIIKSKIGRKAIEMLEYFGKHDGEVQTQLSNNFFTIFWSWVFIAYNPLSEKDPKDKKYAAWRQPVSGTVALGLTLPATMAFNNFLDRKFMSGVVEQNDQRYLYPNHENEKKWGKKLPKFKAEINKKIIDTKATIQDFLVTLNSTDTNPQLKNIKLVKENGRTFIELQENKVVIKDGKEQTEKILRKEFVPEIVDDKSLNKYLSKYNIYSQKFKNFLIKEFEIEFNEEVKEIRKMAFLNKIKNIDAIDFIVKLGILKRENISADELIKFLTNVRIQRKVFKSLFDIKISQLRETMRANLEAIAKKSDNLKNEIEIEKFVNEQIDDMLKKMKPELDAIMKNEHFAGNKSAFISNIKNELCELCKTNARMIQEYKGTAHANSNVNLEQLLRCFGYIRENDPGMEKLNSLNDMSLKVFIDELLKYFCNEELSNFATKIPKNNVDKYLAKNLMNSFIARTNAISSSTKKFAGMIQALPVAIVACFVLNEIYPRVIKKVNPSLLENNKQPQHIKDRIKQWQS